MLARNESEFWPEGATIGDRKNICVEIRHASSLISDPSDETAPWYEVTLWRGSHGIGPQIPVPTLARARTQARLLLAAFAADQPVFERERERRYTIMTEGMKVERDERAKVEAAEHAERLSKITPESEVVTMHVCPNCSHEDEDPEEYTEPVYECSRCGGQQVGEGANRCEECNVFMAKVGDDGCRQCETSLDGEKPETVEGYVVDGTFIPLSEVAA